MHPKHYPIILSIENHAREENRYKMANILTKYLSKQLFYILEEHGNEEIIATKTLGELKGKILLKTDSKLKEILMFIKSH